MKRVLLIALVGILLSTNIALAQNGLVNPEQIAGSTTRITATAGENITANDIVKIINDGGAQAYKYLKQFSDSFGSASVFESASSPYISATRLTDTKFVVCYRDNGNSYYGTAIVGTVSGTTLSWGSASVFESAQSDYISATALSDTKFVVCYQDVGNSNYGTAIVGTVADATLSWGSASVFESANSYYISATALSDTKFVVCYRDAGNGNYGTAIVGTVSGTTLSWGSASVFESASSYYISAVKLSDTKFVVCYMDNGNSYYGTAIVGTVSGTTLSWGSASVFESADSYYISATALSDTKFVVCYQDGGNSYYGTAIVGTVSTTTLSWGSASVFESANSDYISATALSDTKFVVCYRDNGNSYYGTAIVGTVSGTTLSWGSASVFRSASSSYISATRLTDTKFVVCYRDDGNSNYGTAIVGTAAYTGLSIPAFATSSVTSGSSGTFTMLRPFSVITSPNLSLSPASQLFLDANSALSTTINANYYIGFATDTTSIFIDPYPYNQTAASTIPVSLQRK